MKNKEFSIVRFSLENAVTILVCILILYIIAQGFIYPDTVTHWTDRYYKE